MAQQELQDLRRPDPMTAFRFLVRVGDSEEISAAFSRFSGIRMQVETIQSRDGDDNRGVKEYTPVFTSYEPVTLSKGVVGDNELLDWMLAASAGMHSGPTGENLRRTITVIALDAKGEPNVGWVLQDAMPIGYELDLPGWSGPRSSDPANQMIPWKSGKGGVRHGALRRLF